MNSSVIQNEELLFLTQIRKELHKNPELSNLEHQTAERIIHFLEPYKPKEIISQIGGTGLVAIWEGEEKGNTVLLRAELDALAIQEINDFEHKSVKSQVSHKCGHDGHMTMLLGVANRLHLNPVKKGRVILLFQTAEETGEGALKMLQDTKFANINPDYVFAIHNLPGYEKHQIVCRPNTFAAASKGMIIKLHGATAHAGEPENGISPALAMSTIIQRLHFLTQQHSFKDFTLVTVVHALLGEIAFGISPGYAEIRATLRSYLNEDLEKLTLEAEKIIEEVTQEHKLQFEISYTESFSATMNNSDCVSLIEQTAQENKLSFLNKEQPFKWSEDFGQFTDRFQGAMFGLGAGVNTPQLHNSDYDFPDEIMISGINMFEGLIRRILS